MAGYYHRKAASGECAAPSAVGEVGPVALARLEPQRTPARLYTARATPTSLIEPIASRRFASYRGGDPLRAQRAHTRFS
jgi:hypothetical protein